MRTSQTVGRACCACFLVGAMLALAAGGAEAADFSFTGNFVRDDDVQFFDFEVTILSDIVLRTYSYAGGTNAAGVEIPSGGFDPILALFDSSGFLIDQNDDGWEIVAPDPVTGAMFDTYLEVFDIAPGTYRVAIMQYNNFPVGSHIAEGFWRQGEPDFTGINWGPGSGRFYDVTGDQRTGFWAFDILNVDEAPGSRQDDPILPSGPQPPGGFGFQDVPSGMWFDPPFVSIFDFEMTSESLFTAILDFPTGFEAVFTVSVEGIEIGQFGPGESVDFTSFPGGGVPAFRVSGITPLVDAEDPWGFPIQLAFSTPTASFTMTPVPEPSTWALAAVAALALLVVRRKTRTSR